MYLIKKYKINKNVAFESKKLVSFKLVFLIFILFDISININKYQYKQDELTLVSAYYQIKSKHTYSDYFNWISNIVLLNKSFVFFSNKEFMPLLKQLRPKDLYYKTVFIELEINDFYTYRNFYNEFNKTFTIDIENSIHSVPLYLIWGEKSMFLKKAIKNNYFNSKCFYWIDAGYFQEKNKTDMNRYINNWPSTKKCFEDKRLLMGQVKNFSDIFKEKIINFDLVAHKNLQKDINVIGGLFGGQVDNILKFIKIYYKTIKVFAKKNLFIGKDQNLYTYIAFSHPELVKLVLFPNNYLYFKVDLA